MLKKGNLEILEGKAEHRGVEAVRGSQRKWPKVVSLPENPQVSSCWHNLCSVLREGVIGSCGESVFCHLRMGGFVWRGNG